MKLSSFSPALAILLASCLPALRAQDAGLTTTLEPQEQEVQPLDEDVSLPGQPALSESFDDPLLMVPPVLMTSGFTGAPPQTSPPVLSVRDSGPINLSTLGGAPVDRDAAVSYNQWLASSFRTGSYEAGYQAGTLTLRMDSVVPNAHVFLAIVGEMNGCPNLTDICVNFDETPIIQPVDLNSAVTLTFDVDQTVTNGVLLPDVNYWIVFGVLAPDWDASTPTGQYHWSYAAAPGPYAEPAGWSVGGLVATGNTAGQNWATESNTPYLFGLTASPVSVPEPAGAALLTAAACLLARRRHRAA